MTSVVVKNHKPRNNFAYFLVAVSGFSFWFFTAVPFASHRESYMWLAQILREPFANAFGVISTTWRPLAQATTWAAFTALDPSIFPTSALRQSMLQGLVYFCFAVAWWIMYSAVRQPRSFAVLGLIVGGVFFSGYIHLFHLYGLFYVPVILMLAVMAKFHLDDRLPNNEVILATIAILLAFWHPFATTLFLGFYFGEYVAKFRKLDRKGHTRSLIILCVGTLTVLGLLSLSPRPQQPFNPLGFLVSYRTNEVALVASVVAWLLAQLTVMSIRTSAHQKLIISAVVATLGIGFLILHLPLLLLWILVAFLKLYFMRNWALVIPMVVATLLPYGGGLGGPVYALFAITLAAFVTSLDWFEAEQKLNLIGSRYAALFVLSLGILALAMRAGISIPVVSSAAKPLLIERERTYQLEQTLSWLAASAYCSYEIEFTERSGDPVEDVENALTRQYRPPTTIADAGMFWDRVLRCRKGEDASAEDASAKVVTLTFGVSELAHSKSVFEVSGVNAGPLKVWLRE